MRIKYVDRSSRELEHVYLFLRGETTSLCPAVVLWRRTDSLYLSNKCCDVSGSGYKSAVASV